MASARFNLWSTLVGASFAVAGADKMIGQRGYVEAFHHLGWSERAMRLAGTAEAIGGVLAAIPATRAAGSVLLVGASAAVLQSEIRRGDWRLAVPRLGMLCAALTPLLSRRR